jgi:transmembrane sensor
LVKEELYRANVTTNAAAMQRYSTYKAADFLLDDYFLSWLRGNCPETNHTWNEWLRAHPDQKAEVVRARELFQLLTVEEQAVEPGTLEAEWQKLKVRTEAWADFESTPDPKRQPLPLLGWASRIAAAVVFLLMLGWLGSTAWQRYGTGAAASPLKQLRVANGQQLTIKLMDGTVIKLNAGSTLSYPEKFSTIQREVRLTGEAFFEVAPNPAAPFFIRADNVLIRVIGTRFSVKAYPEGEQVRVAVVEGKVGVSTPPESRPAGQKEEAVYLTRDEMATFEKNKKELVVSDFDKNEMLGWKDGVLFFEKASFPEIVRKLERWYGVKIRIRENRKIDAAWRFSGKFENKPIEYILDVCSYPNRFSYQVSEGEVIIK